MSLGWAGPSLARMRAPGLFYTRTNPQWDTLGSTLGRGLLHTQVPDGSEPSPLLVRRSLQHLGEECTFAGKQSWVQTLVELLIGCVVGVHYLNSLNIIFLLPRTEMVCILGWCWVFFLKWWKPHSGENAPGQLLAMSPDH